MVLAFVCLAARAETGHDGWLRYAPLTGAQRGQYSTLPATLVVLGDSPLLGSARDEMIRGVHGMLGRTLRVATQVPDDGAIVIGTIASLRALNVALPANTAPDGFVIGHRRPHSSAAARLITERGLDSLIVAGTTERGALYGAFALLSRIARGVPLAADIIEQPYAPIRWIDQWDNLDGSIERGYAGRSIFFENGHVRADLSRVTQYARLLASLGIDGCNINNVNADVHVLDADFLAELARVADAFRPWGVRMSLSIDLSTPRQVAGLDTFDPLDPKVAQWWVDKAASVYQRIPDLGGFTIKADSEGRLGPAVYGRTPADAANMIARALKPHGGIVFYRAFVYNHHLDWNDLKADRAKAAVENFAPLDGKFDDNVIIQIKHGPIDFQVREPASPLFAALRHTNQAIELQITQEYLGQQRHLVYIPPMWKEVLDFDMHAGAQPTLVRDLVAGRTFHRPLGGSVGVANVGLDENWLAHPLAMSNLYGFGRLAWDPRLSAATIAGEWTQLTFGRDPRIARTLPAMLLSSWNTYESYTGVLGLQTLTDITGTHYGPGIEAAERNGWGQWIRADQKGIGMDRTVATGTGYAGQYPLAVAKMYEAVTTTPEELLLWFHHLPYDYRLRSGKTIVQYVYDAHYTGAARAAQYVEAWRGLRGLIDDARYRRVLELLEYQAGHAIVWRDAVCAWFQKMSGIADARGRVGHYPGRIEAEAMQLTGYRPIAITPPENASGGAAIECAAESCSTTWRSDRASGRYDLEVEYYDMPNGTAEYTVFINDKAVGHWAADRRLPARHLGGDSSVRQRIRDVTLRTGDEIRIIGKPDQQDPAALDYIEISRIATASAKPSVQRSKESK